jgi:nucleolin
VSKKEESEEDSSEDSSSGDECSSEDESSDDDSSSESDEVVAPKKGAMKAAPVAVKAESSDDEVLPIVDFSDLKDSSENSDEDSDSDSEPKPTKVVPLANGKANGTKPAAAKVAKPAVDSDEDSSEDSDSDSDSASGNGKVTKTEDSDEDSSEDSDETSDSDSDEDSDEDDAEEESVPAAAPAASKKRKDAPSSAADTPVKRAKPESTGSTSVFVGNLSWNIDQEWLGKIFEEIGGVESARIITDRDSGRPKGFGYVDFETPEQAQAALELKGTEVDGRPINVDIAQQKTQSDTPNSGRAQKYGDKISEPSATLFVGNLSFNSNEDALYSTFGEIGEIVSVRVPTDRETGEVKGYVC